MKIPFETWQLAQLERMAVSNPAALERALNSLYEAEPDLCEAIVVGAVDQEEISIPHAAQTLQVSEMEIEEKLAAYRKKNLKQHCVVICEGAVAKIADGGVPIWEIVRVHRQLGCFDKLSEAFTGVSPQMLTSALAYAELNGDEIEIQITRYEQMIERKRAEYPYAR